MLDVITENIDIWSSAQLPNTSSGRGRSKNGIHSNRGIEKLRELILELAVRGKLIPQDPNDEPACVLLKQIAKEKTRLIIDGKVKKQKTLPTVIDGEKPFTIPISWEWTRLGNISLINPRNEAKDNTLVSFVPMPLVTTSHTGDHGQDEREWESVKKGYTHFADGDIGLAKITPCFENSKAVVFSNLLNGIGAGTTELHIARPYGETLCPRYILLYLKTSKFLLVGKTKMTGTAGQKRLPKHFFSENPLPLPPLAEQYRIVTKVDKLMVLCDQLEQQQTDNNTAHQTLVETLLGTLTTSDNNRKLQENWSRIEKHFDTLFITEYSIEQLKQIILQLAVMGKLVPQDPKDEPASVLLDRITKAKEQLIEEGTIKKQKLLHEIDENEKPFNLPNGWKYVRLNDLGDWGAGATPLRGRHDYYNGKIPWFKSGELISDYISDSEEYVTELALKETSLRYNKPGDVLIAMYGATIGKCSILKIQATTNQAVCACTPYHGFANKYLLTLLKAYKNRFVGMGAGGAQPNISREKIIATVIALPPLAEQQRIVAKIDELMVQCDILKSKISETQTTQVQLADAIVEKAVVF